MKVLFATSNLGKQAEIKALLQDVVGLELLFPQDIPEAAGIDPEETGATFSENALIKAKAIAEKTNMVCIGEDAGLCVSALNDEPGVFSKRFFPGTDADRNQEILRRLAKKTDRSARFLSVVCLYDPATKKAHYLTGEVRGTIAQEVAGDEGFGYDPIFTPEGHTRTFAQLGDKLKNRLSHRAQALVQLKPVLRKIVG